MYKFLFVGDIMPGELPQKFGFGTFSKFKSSSIAFPFEKIKSILSKGDIVFGNLECALSSKSDEDWPHSSILRGSPVFAESLKYAGFNILNIANNHIMDHGSMAFKETLKSLKKNNIKYFGSTHSGKKQNTIYKYSLGKLKLGFIGFSTEKGISRKFDYVDYDYLRNIKPDLIKYKKEVDVLIFSIHWGNMYLSTPSVEQVKLARELIDCGVDIFIGHHPHVIQGVEKYKKGIIAYSLGNFVSDDHRNISKRGFILSVDVNESGSIQKVCEVPVSINKDYQPCLSLKKKELLYIKSISESIPKLEKLNSKIDYYFKLANRASYINKLSIRLYILLNLYRYKSPYIKYLFLTQFRGILKKLS